MRKGSSRRAGRRRVLWTVVFALLAALFTAAPALAAPMPDSWRQIVAQGGADTAGIESLRVALEEKKIQGGKWNLTPFAFSLSEEALGEANPARARMLMDLALLAAPDAPMVRWRDVRIRIQNRDSLQEAAQSAWVMIVGLVNDPWVRINYGAYAAAVATLASCVVALFLLVLLLPYHFPRFLHDWRDLFPFDYRRVTPVALLVAAFFLLVAVGPGLMIFIFLPAILVLLYLPRRAQIVLGLALTLGALTFPVFSVYGHLAGDPGDRAFLLYRVWRGDEGMDLEARIAQAFGPSNPRALLARAALARRTGEGERALELLDEAEAIGAEAREIHEERGNLYFLAGRLEDAAKEYETMQRLDPGDWIPFYNASLVSTLNLDVLSAEQSMARARALAPKEVERQEVHAPEGRGEIYPAFRDIPVRWIYDEVLKVPAETPWVEKAWSFFGSPHRYLRPFHAALFILFLSLAAIFAKKDRISDRCQACGALRCPRCNPTVKEEGICSACWALRQGGVAADETSRERVRASVARWARRSRKGRWLVSALVPGWGSFAYEGAAGAFMGIVWAVAAASFLMGILFDPPLLPWRAGWFPWASLAVVVICHLAALTRARVRKAGG